MSPPQREEKVEPGNANTIYMRPGENRNAFIVRVFNEYYPRVFAFARKTTSIDRAEDISQEVFLRLMQHPRLEEMTFSSGYLIKIAQNLISRQYTRNVMLYRILNTILADRQIQRHGRTDRIVRQAHHRALDISDVESAFSTLSRDEQSAIRLIIHERKSYEQAARSLGISTSTLNNWKYRGLAKLRDFAGEAAEKKGNDKAFRVAI